MRFILLISFNYFHSLERHCICALKFTRTHYFLIFEHFSYTNLFHFKKLFKHVSTLINAQDEGDEDGDFTIDNGTERKKMSLAENPFAEFFPAGSPEQPKKMGSKPNSRQASLDKASTVT